jgi:hypothetical protein
MALGSKCSGQGKEGKKKQKKKKNNGRPPICTFGSCLVKRHSVTWWYVFLGDRVIEKVVRS